MARIQALGRVRQPVHPADPYLTLREEGRGWRVDASYPTKLDAQCRVKQLKERKVKARYARAADVEIIEP